MMNGYQRPATVVIANPSPLIEGGRYPAKRVVGERLSVEADIFKDGHDVIRAEVSSRLVGAPAWTTTPLAHINNDRWGAEFHFGETGQYELVIRAWSDDAGTWIHDFERRLTGDQSDFATEIEEGRVIFNQMAIRAASARAPEDAEAIEQLTTRLMKTAPSDVPALMNEPAHLELISRWPDRSLATEIAEPLSLVVETKRSNFSAWYEFFPRSASGAMERHSTFRDCLPRLDDAAAMGFDIVYFPPIHPIGISHRKGKNNTLTASADDVGSPWAIGGAAGGHRAIEPALGTFADFAWIVEEAKARGLEIALDFAINCSPDHPYVKEHPEWFYQRPDGSIKYAENPPKKYQDIYPLNFHCDDWQDLWNEMLAVVRFWIAKGVRVFRVDNPHTKPVSFWEWLIGEIHQTDPDIIFLSEAFTKPKMMQALAKAGFTQSYTYYTWRVSKAELSDYVTELTKGEMRDYYRANFWPNTPDILPFHLQHAPPAAFKVRAALAATLSSCWGMYSGYEFCENEPLPDREEYLDSEKFQLKNRDWDAPGNLKGFLTRLNASRRSEAALQSYANIEFIYAENDQVIAFYKWDDSRSSLVLVVANLDFENTQESTLHLPLAEMGLDQSRAFQVEDLIFGETYEWRESSNFVSLDPRSKPVHVFRVTQD